MKYTDNLLMIAAGYSLYTLTIIFSNNYFSGINHWIPDIFSDSASISIGTTFHQVVASLIVGMLLVRFQAKAVLIAFIIAVIVNLEAYVVALTTKSAKATMDYYLANPSAAINLLKPIVLLPLMTYLVGLIKRIEPPAESLSD